MKKLLLTFSLLLASFGYAQTYFSDNFDDLDITDWTVYDQDGDGKNWYDFNDTQQSYNTNPALVSVGINSHPDNYIVSPVINLSTASSAQLKYKVKVLQNTTETYSVYAATTNSVAAFLANGPLLTETVNSNGPIKKYYLKTIDLSAYAGQQVYIAFRHNNSNFLMFLDDVSVTAVPATAPNCSALISPANMATSVHYTPSAKLTWNSPSTGSIVDSYDIYMDQNSNPGTLISNVITGTSYDVSGLMPSTTYYWKAVPKNTAGSATGCPVYSFTTPPTDFCNAGTNHPVFARINNVTFADINNNSSNDYVIGYEDYTSIIGNVVLGQAYDFSALSLNQGIWDQVLVWIDFNNDFDFDDAGEKVLETVGNNHTPLVGQIAIPPTATLGTVRMRVRLNNANLNDPNNYSNQTPCGNAAFGQVEDYTLNIGNVLSVKESSKVSIKAFPNPVTDILHIESPSKVKSVSVVDASGKFVSSYKLNTAKSQINLSGLVPGIYFVNIEMEDVTQSIKVIKK